MSKSQRVKLYEWCGANKSNSGAIYPRVVKVTHRGYEMIRSNFSKNKPYAGYKIISGIGEENKQLQIFIK